MSTPRQPRVTVFDLSNSQLVQLERFDRELSSARWEARKPSRLRAKVYPGSGDDYSRDLLYFDLAVHRLANVADSRKVWLKAHKISAFVAKQARDTFYHPHGNAELIGLVAPPAPAEDADASVNAGA